MQKQCINKIIAEIAKGLTGSANHPKKERRIELQNETPTATEITTD